MSTLLPNTFQCFNLYIDRALEHLTDSEVRILWYATRHILGWQDKIKKRHGHISLTMFENGYITEAGKRYGGCGLGRGAIITACTKLVEFKFLAKIGEPTEDGQEWELTTDDIQWAALESRTLTKNEGLKSKTRKATQARIDKRASTSNVPPVDGTSHVTMQGTSDVTPPGTSNELNQSQSSKPDTKPFNAPRKRSERPQDLFYNAVRDAFGWTASGRIISVRDMMLGRAKRGTWKDCNFEPPVTDPQEITDFGDYMRKTISDINREYEKKSSPTRIKGISAAVTIQSWFYDFRASLQKKSSESTQPTEAEMNIRTPDYTERIAQWQKEREAAHE